MFLSAGLVAASLSISATKKSLYSLQTHSGYSAVKKNMRVVNERALVGTRMRRFNITESLASVLLDGLTPWHEAGNSPPLAAIQSSGADTLVPRFWPPSNGAKDGED